MSNRSRGLADAAVAITRAASLAEVLETVTGQAAILIGAHQAMTSLAADADGSPAYNHIYLSDKYSSWRDFSEPADGGGIHAIVREMNQPVRLTQAELEAHPQWRGFGGQRQPNPPMAGWLAAPLIGRDGKNIGLIQLSDKIDGEFDARDEADLVQFAQMAAGAVENARLRRELEDANRRAQERTQELEALMDALPAAVWIAHDREGTNITGSRASYELLRQPYGVNVSLSAGPGIAPVNFKVCQNGKELRPEDLPVQRAARLGQTLEGFEEQVVFSDGEVRHLVGNATPLTTPDGEVRGAIAAFVDVTAMRLADRAIRESERRQRLLVQVVDSIRHLDDPEAIAQEVCRVTATFLEVSRCAFARVDVGGSSVHLVDHPGDEPSMTGQYSFDTFGEAMMAAMEEGKPVVIEDASIHPLTRERYSVGYAPFELRSFISIPILQDGRLVAGLGALSSEPRRWTDEEAALLTDVAHRVWDGIERARVLRELRRATDRYRALAETAASVVFSADAEGLITGFPCLRGVDPSVAKTGLGNGWVEMLHPDDQQIALAAWLRAVSIGEEFRTEFRVRVTDGDYRWHNARAVRVRSGDGSPAEWIGAWIDAHERVTTNRALRLVNELTAATRSARSADEVITQAQRLLGENLRVTRCAYGEAANGGRRFAMPPNYCVGCEDLSGRFPISGYDSPTSEALRRGEILRVCDVAREMTAEAGRDAFLAAAIAAVVCVPVMKDGHVVAMLGVHQDRPRVWTSDEVELVRTILERTWSELERVRAEQAVQRSEQRLRLTLEAATIGVVLNDAPGRFLYANEPLLRLLGYTQEDLEAGRLSWDVVQVPELRPRDDLALDQLRATGCCEPYETEFLARDGRRIPVYVGAALVPDSEGSGQLGAAFVTDLTAIKQAERELVRLNTDLERRVRERTAELEAANREMEGFTYTVAHDLRGPLRAVVASARILQDEAADRLNDDHRRLLDRQASNAIHLARLLDDLLIYARISRQDVRRQPVDFSETARRVADAVREERPNQIIVQDGLCADADPDLLKLVLQNLLDNGCKFSPMGGPVVVGHAVTPRGSAFFVRDAGVGFDMAHARKLFQPFERLVRQDEFPGTGIGLANVKRVIERHGGKIWAESVKGQGSTFWFTLSPDSQEGE